MNTIKTLGQVIRELREEQDLSLRELAARVKKSAAFLSDVELGRRHPTDIVLAELAKHLGITLAKLKEYDTRAPVEEIRRMSNANPVYGLAFRKIVNKHLSPQELLKLAESAGKTSKK